MRDLRDDEGDEEEREEKIRTKVVRTCVKLPSIRNTENKDKSSYYWKKNYNIWTCGFIF